MSLLFPFVSLLVSLLVDHCVRLVSLLLSFVSFLSPFLLGHCVRLVSLLSPFVSGLVSLLVGHCVRLVSLLFPFVSLLVSVPPYCWSLCPPCLPSFLYICLLSPPLACNPSHLSPSCSALQSFKCVSLCLHLSPSSGLPCPPLPCNPLHLSPSSGLLCPPLPCNPLHVSSQAFAFVSMSLAILYICLPVSTFVSQLWTAVVASALQSFVSQPWTSQALVAECSDFEKHKLFGVYGGVILSCPSVFLSLHPHSFLSLACTFVRTLACTHTRTRILLTTRFRWPTQVCYNEVWLEWEAGPDQPCVPASDSTLLFSAAVCFHGESKIAAASYELLLKSAVTHDRHHPVVSSIRAFALLASSSFEDLQDSQVSMFLSGIWSLRFAVWRVALTSVRNSICVSLLVRAQGEPEECPVDPSNGGLSLSPLPRDVRVQSGQQEAYGKVTWQDLTDY